jgi:hypothetical protein
MHQIKIDRHEMSVEKLCVYFPLTLVWMITFYPNNSSRENRQRSRAVAEQDDFAQLALTNVKSFKYEKMTIVIIIRFTIVEVTWHVLLKISHSIIIIINYCCC